MHKSRFYKTSWVQSLMDEGLYNLFRKWIEEGKIPEIAQIGHYTHHKFPSIIDHYIIHLLGYSSPDDMAVNYRPIETNRAIQLLLGPHGWAVYKMLLARANA
jgi:hypothetical protein